MTTNDRFGLAPTGGAAQDAGRLRMERLERAMLHVARRLWAGTRAQNTPYRVDKAAYATLSRLEQSGETRLSDLAVGLDLDLSTVSRQIRLVEQLGLVERRPDPTDGRASLVRLTAAGGEELDRQRAVRQNLLGVAVQGWPEDDRARLVALVERLAADLETRTGSANFAPAAARTAPHLEATAHLAHVGDLADTAHLADTTSRKATA